MLPKRIAKPKNRSRRWRSQAHTAWVRGFHCVGCGSSTNIVAAHVRLGSHTGMSAKPDDWRCVPLCDGPNSNAEGMLGCHNSQHFVGEQSFWNGLNIDPEQLIAELIKASPRRSEIEREMREREVL